MKRLLSAALLLSSSLSFCASNFPKANLWKCEKRMVETINKQNIRLRGKWMKKSVDPVNSIFSSATTKVSQWVTIERSAEGKEALAISDATQVSRFEYDLKKGCETTVKHSAVKKSQRTVASGGQFDDQDLADLLNKKPNGIIFIWSPHMSLSLKSVPELRTAAEELGLPITFVLDPQADQQLAEESSKKLSMGEDSLKRFDSYELSMRNALVHFPALIVTREGKVCSKIQRGYRKAEKYRAIISDIFGGCK